MFQNGDFETPTAVAMLDWQVSCLHSPATDLGYYLYIVSSEEDLAKLDEYLQYYHNKLSENIREMGSDPEKLFPFSTLLDHFNKYSVYGMGFIVSAMEMMLSSKEDAISMDDFDDDFEMTPEAMKEQMDKIKPKNVNTYRDRARGILNHYFKHVLNVI